MEVGWLDEDPAMSLLQSGSVLGEYSRSSEVGCRADGCSEGHQNEEVEVNVNKWDGLQYSLELKHGTVPRRTRFPYPRIYLT